MTPSQAVYLRSLVRAAEVVGDMELLAEFLGVQPKQLALWMSGVVQTPVDVFLKVVDLLMGQRDAAPWDPGAPSHYEGRRYCGTGLSFGSR